MHQTADEIVEDFEFVKVKQEKEYKYYNENYDDSADNNPSFRPGCRSTNPQIKEENSKEEDGLSASEAISKINAKPPLYECKKCFEKFPDINSLTKHREETKHPQRVSKPSACPVCNKMYSFMKQHMRTHTGEKPYCCEIKPKPPYYECKKCLEKFSDIKGLKKHREEFKHSPIAPTLCPVCNKMIGYSLTQHMRTHTGEKPYGCEICGARFSESGSLCQHKRIQHAGPLVNKILIRGFQCKECARTFSTKQYLQQHSKIHGEKKFLCNVCGRGFGTNSFLVSHSKIHAGVRPYVCHVCGKTFTVMRNLAMHKLIHTGEKLNVCSVCSKSFTQPGQLKSHMNIHTREKPYSCAVCSKAFTQPSSLKHHMRLHTGEKPYSCDVCGKSFSLLQTLAVHKIIHPVEKPYVCPICGKGFLYSRNMKRHERGHDKQNLVL